MKTIIGAVVGVGIIILLVVIARPAKKTVPTDTTTTSEVVGEKTDSQKQPMTTATTFEKTTTKEGAGTPAQAGDTVTVNYTGKLTNGTVFDSNVDPKFGHVQPFSFKLGSNMVIQGWEKGVLGMKVGEKRHLVIPGDLGYGAGGFGNAIPPNATLEFDVEVLSIKK